MRIIPSFRGRNRMAFSGHLWCPRCSHDPRYDPKRQSWKLDRYITPTLIRYICKKCGSPIRYDVSNRPNVSSQELVRMGKRT